MDSRGGYRILGLRPFSFTIVCERSHDPNQLPATDRLYVSEFVQDSYSAIPIFYQYFLDKANQPHQCCPLRYSKPRFLP